MTTLTRKQTSVLSRTVLFFTVCNATGMTRKQACEAFYKTHLFLEWGPNITVGAMWDIAEMAGYDLNKFDTN